MLMRLQRWAQEPDNELALLTLLGMLALFGLLASIEHAFGWPDLLMPKPGYSRGQLPFDFH